ncbi:hypothetical protein D046_7336A, partial [Vibrio parahaemolyticus V-223/04]
MSTSFSTFGGSSQSVVALT